MSRPQWIMAGGAVIALALTAGLGWSSWTQSPTYALRAVARSVEHHDRYEFEKYVDGLVTPTLWHRGRCLSYGDGLVYWALAEVVRQRLGIAEDDDRAVAGTRLAEGLERWVPSPG